MNGIDAIRHIMISDPVPIVAMSASSDVDDIVNGFHALEAGAVAFSEKPRSMQDPRYEYMCASLVQTIKLMSEVKVVRRRDRNKATKKINEVSLQSLAYPIARDIQVIAIGVSTGGPLVLQTILSQLPTDFPPILIVQHIVPGFIDGLAKWLAQGAACRITVAKGTEIPERGHVYLAPDYHHMGLMQNGRIYLKPNGKNKDVLCPSVDFLFNSVANVSKDKSIGILLTGMGSDGAQQLKYMREQGAVTIAQDEESSLIYGMPGSAVKLDAAIYTLTPEQIVLMISSLSRSAK
jgi:two-component system chemotaxis response regulator CheB